MRIQLMNTVIENIEGPVHYFMSNIKHLKHILFFYQEMWDIQIKKKVEGLSNRQIRSCVWTAGGRKEFEGKYRTFKKNFHPSFMQIIIFMNCHYVQIQFRLYLVDSAQLNLITVPSTYLDYGNGNPLLNTRVKSFEVQTFEKF